MGVTKLDFPLLRYSTMLLLTSALVSPVLGQGAIQQSGVVTTAHFACWLANGIVNDCGISSLNPSGLPVIANGHVIGNASGSAIAATDYSLTSILDTLATPAQGDILYRNGSVWTYLHAGTSGQFLQTLGASANPAWATPTPTAYSGSASILLTGTTFSISAPVTVPNGGTGLTAGTSGGIPAYTNATTLASSGLLTAHGVMLGGGAGAVPSALSSLGTSGQVLTSNGAAANPSWSAAASGTVTQINAGSCLSGGPITSTGTISAVAATSGVCGSVTPDTNATHFLNGGGAWTAAIVPGTGLSFSSGNTLAITSPTLSGTTAAIGGSTLTAACTSGTVAIASATTAMAVVATPVTYPGDTIRWAGYVSSAGTVTVKVCAEISGTPTSSAYVAKVIQ